MHHPGTAASRRPLLFLIRVVPERSGGGVLPRGAAPRDYPKFQWRYERAFPSSRLPAPDGPPSRIHLACSMHAKLGVGEAGKGRMTILDARCGKAGPERIVKLDGTPARGLMASGDSVSRDTVSSRAGLFCSEKRTRIVGDKLMPWREYGDATGECPIVPSLVLSCIIPVASLEIRGLDVAQRLSEGHDRVGH